MLMSVLEASVPPEKWEPIKAAYRITIKNIPPRMCQTLLIQSVEDASIWKVITIWRIQRSHDQILKEVEKCGAYEIFRTAGIEPKQTVFKVALSAQELDLGSDLTETPITDMLSPTEDSP